MTRKIAALFVACAVLVPAVALAATPVAGGKYSGKVAGKKVTLKLEKGSVSKGKVVVDCGKTGGGKQSAIGVKVKDDGSFDAKAKTPFKGEPPPIELKGKFKSSSKAKAKLTLIVCDGKGGKVTLKQK